MELNFQKINSKADYKEWVRQDGLANSWNNRSSKRIIIEFLYPNPIEVFLKTLRKYEYLYNKNKKSILTWLKLAFVQVKFRRISTRLGFSIPINTFGPGLSIPHYGTIVVSRYAKIGKNCRLHAGVNIGASAGNKEAPKIGDNVYIGPGAILFGNINIADNVTIGANATVNKSFLEKNCVIAGSPAKIVKSNFPIWWENNRLQLN